MDRPREDGPQGARSTPYDDIAQAVMQARIARGWTQRRLAQAIGTSNTAVSRIESGRHRMSVATLQRLADVLGVPFTVAPRRVPAATAVDRSEIRRAIRMRDREREAYYLASNQNMLRLFEDAARSS